MVFVLVLIFCSELGGVFLDEIVSDRIMIDDDSMRTGTRTAEIIGQLFYTHFSLTANCCSDNNVFYKAL